MFEESLGRNTSDFLVLGSKLEDGRIALPQLFQLCLHQSITEALFQGSLCLGEEAFFFYFFFIGDLPLPSNVDATVSNY